MFCADIFPVLKNWTDLQKRRELFEMFADIVVNHFYKNGEIVIIHIGTDMKIKAANSYAFKMLGEHIAGENIKDCFVEFQEIPDLEDIGKEGKECFINYNFDNNFPQTLKTTFYKTDTGLLLIGEANGREMEILRKELISMNNQLNNTTRELYRKNSELERLNKIKNQFLGIACHDLRTPLNSMGLLCEMLKDDISVFTEEELSRYLGMLEEQIKFMSELVKDMLDISAIESGAMILRTERYDFADEIGKLEQTYSMIASKWDVKFNAVINEGDYLIQADRNKLKQVVDNIVGNAIKYSDKGQEVKLLLSEDGENIKITISDEGPGIPEHLIADIFKPFSRMHIETPRKEQSSGLGLAISEKIVKAHKGSIEVKSVECEGSEFVVRICKKI